VQHPIELQLPGLVTNLGRATLAIGGVRTSLVSSDPTLTLELPEPVGRFAVDPEVSGPAHIRLTSHWGVAPPLARSRPLFDSGGVWQLEGNDDQLLFRFTSPQLGRDPYKTAVMSADFSSGAVYLNERSLGGRPRYPLEYPLDELLVTNWLALGRGVEMHACGVRDVDGRGLLFLAHSGGGKSTIASLWRKREGVTILSDDRIILRSEAGDIWMYGTPWHGDEELAAPLRVKLSRAFFLRHAPRTVALPMDGALIVARLVACSFPPFFRATGLDFTLEFLSDVRDRVAFDELGFVPEPSAIDHVRSIR
jgi:hypothetical protein